MNPQIEDYFTEAERSQITLEGPELSNFDNTIEQPESLDTADAQARSKELYGILRMLVEGEAKTVIKNNRRFSSSAIIAPHLLATNASENP